MTRGIIVTDIIKKCVLPIVFGTIFLFALVSDLSSGTSESTYFWLLIGFPFGFGKMRSWLFLKGGDLGSTVGIFVLNIVLGAVIGGFVLLWRMAVGLFRLPVLIYRLINFHDTTELKTE